MSTNTSTANILLVDDNKLVAKGFSRELEHAGYKAKVAFDGPTALDLASHQHFDIVFTDFVMPGMDGLELCRKVKKLSPKTQVVVVSGYPQAWAAHVSEFLSLGGRDENLVKPLVPNQIVLVAKKILGDDQREVS